MAILKQNRSPAVPSSLPKPTSVVRETRTTSGVIKGADEMSLSLLLLPLLAQIEPSAPHESDAVFPVSTGDEGLDSVIIQQQLHTFRQSQFEQISQELETYRIDQMAQIDREKTQQLEAAYHEGLERGQHEGYLQLQAEIDRFIGVIDDALTQKHAFLDQARPDILSLSVRMAEKILHRHLSDHQDDFSFIIDEALTRITDKEKVVIRMHPDHASFARLYKETILMRMPEIKYLEIQEDSKVEFGGCIIETKMGYVDASLTVKLETLSNAILAVHNDEKGH